MKKQSKTLIFFGNERILTGIDLEESHIFSALIKNGYNIKAVFLENKDTKSRKSKTNVVQDLAQSLDIPVYKSLSTDELIKKIKDLKPDIAVLVSYGKLLKSNVLDLIPHGIINIHPSLLPKYRGTTPIETALLHGDTIIGISLMKLTEGMDSGPIYLQKEITISPKYTKIDIANKILNLASNMLIQTLPKILSNALKPYEQNEKNATFTQKIDKSKTNLEPSQESAFDLNNKIRSMQYYPKAKIEINGIKIIINQSHVSKQKTGLSFECKDGNYIVVDKLISPSGKEIAGDDFIRGYLKN